ncbi:ClpP/crotonase [Meredithblackwellia eburnea MCA 4105]
MSQEPILLEVKDGFAIITLNRPQAKNAMDITLFKRLAKTLYAIDARADVFLTIVTGRGDFFSAGADVKAHRAPPVEGDARSQGLARLSEGNMDLARALYSHSKLLVAALNGPAIGLSAAVLGFFDFIYAVENAYILTPFSTLSLVAEGGASYSFPRRMGIAKANEALIMGKKLTAPELQANGFLNKVFPQSSDATFLRSVLQYLKEQFEDLDQEAVVITKQLIKATLPDPEPSNVREIFAGALRVETGKPQAQFARMAAKTKRHKL